ncbi:AmmeMemoRadiSam system radical SAM enzyme [Methylomonas sp. AM2-LC]|uniref:AmmeMemoRadiSam system radical SAM enzyme n=1 Tax=Methylomonas sp. AM2-LC TaxID=3153301 RepID=UPI0032667A65
MINAISENIVSTRYWHTLDQEQVQCDLCPRFCKLREGQRGLCFVRQNLKQQIVLTSYGRSSGFVIEPIEKKPLNQFLPGTAVLSFGTAGCNLACKFCQNWDISKSRDMDKLMSQASPLAIVEAAVAHGCSSVAYTYNDPVVFHEYAIDTAKAAREQGLKSVAVTAGYVCNDPRMEFYQWMDAANVDLKSFSETFYHKITGSHLQPVLETLLYLKHETQVWLELTTLIIPGENDSQAELEAMTQWVVENLGPDVPMHFTAFHPDWKMMDKPRTPASSLLMARSIALKNGVHYAYVGNIKDTMAGSTYCHHCRNPLIVREGYELLVWNLDSASNCRFCGCQCAGVFKAQAGNWGAKRQVLHF